MIDNNFKIPKNRNRISNSEFEKLISRRRDKWKLGLDKLYDRLKYNIIKFCCTWGIAISIVALFCSSIFHQDEIKQWCIFYLQTLVTLYVGSLMTKDNYR